MTGEWVLVALAATTAGGGALGYVWRGGRREGKIDAVLERLTGITEDHEDRIRDLEHGPKRR